MEAILGANVKRWRAVDPSLSRPAMAKLEIPSIVVQSGSGSHSPPNMEASHAHWTLSSQDESEQDLTSSVDEVEPPPAPAPNPSHNNILPRSRSKANLKLLKRSHAIKESTSPPPDICLSPVNSPTQPDNNNSVTVNNNSRVLRRDSSTESNWSATPSLSRGNSIEQCTDQSGIDIEQFIIDTLNKNTKDRMFLLRIENDLVALAKDSRKNSHKFGAMSSYQRMLVHRVAHYFGMDHNVDSSGHMVVVNKSKTTRVPDSRFTDFIRVKTDQEIEDNSGKSRKICFGPEKVKKVIENGHKTNERDDLLLSEEPRRSILKRDSASFEDTVSFKSPDRHLADAPRRSKSFEEREEEYEKARRRIFHQEQGDSQEEEDLRWPQQLQPQGNWTSTDSTKLHPNSHRPSRLAKMESYESKDTLKANSLRSSISKSYSFGGYDQNQPNQRVLTKQDSGSSVSSRVSPSSSGYKSQSQRSDTTMSATPSPTATPHLATQLSGQSQSGPLSPEPEQPTVMWAVTNMSAVPAGSVLINPQTGQPFTNDDGSIYHFDPAHPPNFERQNSVLRPPPPPRFQNGPNHGVEPGRGSGQGQGEGGEPVTAHAQPALTHTLSLSHSHSDAHPGNEVGGVMLHMGHGVPPPLPPPSHMQYPAHLVVPPPTEPPHPHPPTMYAPAPAPMGYDRLSLMDGSSPDMCSYIMNLSLADGRNDVGHRPVFYCPSGPAPPHAHAPAHYPQAVAPAAPMPMYLAPAPAAAPRYPCTYAAAPYAPDPTRPAGAECSYPQPQPPVHAYYSRCPSGQVSGAPNYCPANGSNGGGVMGVVTLPLAPISTPAHAHARSYHRPPLPTPPTTPQNGCTLYSNGYAAMPGCYPHYQPANPPIPRPALQLNMCSSPRSEPDVTPQHQQHSASPLRFTAPAPMPAHAPLYRFTYPTNELILLNASRSPFSAAAGSGRCAGAAATPLRRHRPRSVGIASATGRPTLGMGAASQQQAALATAIEVAGLAAQSGGYHIMTTH